MIKALKNIVERLLLSIKSEDHPSAKIVDIGEIYKIPNIEELSESRYLLHATSIENYKMIIENQNIIPTLEFVSFSVSHKQLNQASHNEVALLFEWNGTILVQDEPSRNNSTLTHVKNYENKYIESMIKCSVENNLFLIGLINPLFLDGNRFNRTVYKFIEKIPISVRQE